jgi:uncharacterized membrane protein
MQHLTPEKIVAMWLIKLGIRVSPGLLSSRMKGHPDYPSLLSITDTLDALGIQNEAVKVERNALHKLPKPFLAHLSTQGGQFVIAGNNHVLGESWTGVALLAISNHEWKHAENNEFLRKEKAAAGKVITGFALVFLIALAAFLSIAGWIIPALMAVAVTGMFLSWLIVSKELGIENSIADQVCGQPADCMSIIKSRGAKLPFGISLSDAGIVWFAGLSVSLVLSAFATNAAGILPVLSILAPAGFAVALFSIYYQWFIAKKWCRICLFVQALLVAQLIILFNTLTHFSIDAVQIKNALFIAAILLLTGISWFSFKSLLLQNRRLEAQSLEAARFKRNEHVFRTVLSQQKEVDATPWPHDLQLGNAASPMQLIVACNLFCKPCASTHEKLHRILEQFGDKIGLSLRFTDKRTQPLQYILRHIAQSAGHMDAMEKSKYCRNVLHDWFRLMNYEQFTLKYVNTTNLNVDSLLKQHEEWSSNNSIEYTPAIFVNGRELPSAYTLDDLTGLLIANFVH